MVQPYVQRLLEEFRELNPAAPPEVVVAGSLRRGAPVVGDVDLVLVNPEGSLEGDLLTPGVVLPTSVAWDRHGAKVANGSIPLPDGPFHVDLWACTPVQRGGFLCFATGPMQLNLRQRSEAKRRGLGLSQNGLFDADGRQLDDGTEEGVYRALGWQWVSPQDRQRWAER